MDDFLNSLVSIFKNMKKFSVERILSKFIGFSANGKFKSFNKFLRALKAEIIIPFCPYSLFKLSIAFDYKTYGKVYGDVIYRYRTTLDLAPDTFLNLCKELNCMEHPNAKLKRIMHMTLELFYFVVRQRIVKT